MTDRSGSLVRFDGLSLLAPALTPGWDSAQCKAAIGPLSFEFGIAVLYEDLMRIQYPEHINHKRIHARIFEIFGLAQSALPIKTNPAQSPGSGYCCMVFNIA